MTARTRKTTLILAAAAVIASASATASQFSDQQSLYPVRVLARLAAPLARGLEWAVARPFEWLTSRDHIDVLTMNPTWLGDEEFAWKWGHGDYRPSIAEARKAQAEMKNTAKK